MQHKIDRFSIVVNHPYDEATLQLQQKYSSRIDEISANKEELYQLRFLIDRAINEIERWEKDRNRRAIEYYVDELIKALKK